VRPHASEARPREYETQPPGRRFESRIIQYQWNMQS
jgi:hypothetical protein